MNEENISMFCQLDAIFEVFRPCFSRKATFYWFIIVIVRFYVRCDHNGLTSIIRWLSLTPTCYDSLIKFFYSTAWSVDTLFPLWVTWVLTHCPLMEFEGRLLLIGDGIKIAKESRKMPGVKCLHQDSNNNGKKASIRGHHFGVVGILVGSVLKTFCLPLRAELHEGVDKLRLSEGLNGQPPTLITRMARLLLATAQITGRQVYATLDAYFAVGPTFLIFKEQLNEQGEQLVHLITRAKDNTAAYFMPEDDGKRFKKRDHLKLMELFDHPYLFTTVEVLLYGKSTIITYYYVDLLWKPIDGLLRFVLIQDGESRFILMCSDLTLSPYTILKIYTFRVKIEVTFGALKNLLGGFCYHFWTTCYPKPLRGGATMNLSKLSESAQQHLDSTLTAIERFVNLAVIALGILQFFSLTAAATVWQNYTGWLRTYSSTFPSERVIKTVLATEFFERHDKVLSSRTFQIIQTKKHSSNSGKNPFLLREK